MACDWSVYPAVIRCASLLICNPGPALQCLISGGSAAAAAHVIASVIAAGGSFTAGRHHVAYYWSGRTAPRRPPGPAGVVDRRCRSGPSVVSATGTPADDR